MDLLIMPPNVLYVSSANVSAGGNPTTPVEAALKVPGIFIIGKFDALMGERGITRTDELLRICQIKRCSLVLGYGTQRT